IFIGPTFPVAQAAKLLSADYRPPSKQGDVYLACKDKPKVIGIIDGYFESTPSVWHKEILYALSQGIHVYGCSSMGALRAAELAMYGMQGVGEVYQQFADGKLEDDDEVAVTHAPAELHYQPISQAMVNIRATLQAARDSNIINTDTTTTLTAQAKNCWYPERHYDAIIAHAASLLTPVQCQALKDFITHHEVDVKRNDALLLLKQLGGLGNLPAKIVNFNFVNTDAWAQLVEQQEQVYFQHNNPFDMAQLHDLLARQGRLDSLKTEAIARQICLQKAKRIPQTPSPEQFKSTLITFAQQQNCVDNGQIDFVKLSQWFDDQRLNPDSFDQLMQNQARLQSVDNSHDNVEQEMLDILRLNGELAELLALAEHKGIVKQDVNPSRPGE
ncbi:MAG: hypothetical protein HRT35_38345, partial [Algicola sp.]|nr:hypothetical protein [Algicola sp.]